MDLTDAQRDEADEQPVSDEPVTESDFVTKEKYLKLKRRF
jgi:hypothetical protein